MSHTSDAILTLDDVTLAYDGHPAVSHVSFDVLRGENLCLIGANGSGKSTLIKGILGLMPVTHGKIHLEGGLSRVGYLAQIHTVDRDFPATVWEIVLSGTQKRGRRLPFYTHADRENARRAMTLLKIEAFAGRRIGHLSGGQTQRALLARAIVRQPELLILDEPCSALDPDITQELYQLFDELKRQLGLTILISSHDLAYVEQHADRVAVLGGTLEYVGPVSGWMERKGGMRL